MEPGLPASVRHQHLKEPQSSLGWLDDAGAAFLGDGARGADSSDPIVASTPPSANCRDKRRAARAPAALVTTGPEVSDIGTASCRERRCTYMTICVVPVT